MTQTSCPIRQVLLEYDTGKLADPLAESVKAHVKSCRACQATLKSFGESPAAPLPHAEPVDALAHEPERRQMLERVKAMAETIVLQDSATAQTPNEPVSLGTLGEYELFQKLGQGGMGTVYKARHTRLDKLVAVKVLPAGAMRDPASVARFEREMRAVGRLEHPHIVRAMDAGQVGGRHYLVMEYVDGLDLSEVVQRCGPLRIADACEVVRQAALGLRYADEHAMVHRDIKPSNLVLNSESQVKILDLGLALILADRPPKTELTRNDLASPPVGVLAGAEISSPSRIVGTLDYIAPEQCWDSHDVDIRADIYGLGCTFYKLLSGQAPFVDAQYKGAVDKMMAHVQVPPPPLGSLRREIPEKLAAVVDRMMAKKRDDRYALPGQVVEALQPYCPGCDLAGLLARAGRSVPTQPKAVASPAAPVTACTGSAEAGTLPPIRTGQPPSPPAPVAGAVTGIAVTGIEESFDAYYKWLGIPPDEQPPNHYRLLGIRIFEEDRDVIQIAAEGRSTHLKTRVLGKHSGLSQKLLNEVQQAKLCLLTPDERAAYDASLRCHLEAEAAAKSKSKGASLPAVPPPAATATRRFAGRSKWPAFLAKAERALRVVWSAVAFDRRTLLRLTLVLVTAAAAFVCLGLVLYVTAGKGTVKIELGDPTAKVEVKVDGNRIDIAGLKEPLSLSVGEHELEVSSGEFKTVTRQFTIRRGEQEVVSVSLLPKSNEGPDIPLPLGEGQGDAKPVAGRSGTKGTPVPTASAPPPAIAPFDAAQAQKHQETWAKHLRVPVETTNSIGMKLVLIPPGEFDMGATDEEVAWAIEQGKKGNAAQWYFDQAASEAPRHRVNISRPFYMGSYPVTQGEYQRVMDLNPSDFAGQPADVSQFDPPLSDQQKDEREANAKKVAGTDTSSHPVERVSWEDAAEFCRRLSALPAESSAGRVYSLPTEAQWEYACRGGSTSRWWWGDDESRVTDVAWLAWNSDGMTHPVGQKQRSAWGLDDMQGNVTQWCSDWFGQDYYKHSNSLLVDPAGPSDGTDRVLRGAHWLCGVPGCRSAYRAAHSPLVREPYRGFRVVWAPAVPGHESETAGSSPHALRQPTTASSASRETLPQPRKPALDGDGFFVVEGKRVFPIGMWAGGPPRDVCLKAGFNWFALDWWEPQIALDLGPRKTLMFLAKVDDKVRSNTGNLETAGPWIHNLRQISECQHVLACWAGGENKTEGALSGLPTVVEALSRAGLPFPMMAMGRRRDGLSPHWPWVDVLYAWPGLYLEGGDPPSANTGIRPLLEERPPGTAFVGEAWLGYNDAPAQIARQARCRAYLSIAAGANGLFFAGMKEKSDQSPLWPHLVDLVREIRSLERFLVASPDGPLQSNRVCFAARRCGNEALLIACNPTGESVSQDIPLPKGCESAAEIQVIGENRTVLPSGRTIRDEFDALAVHLYLCRIGTTTADTSASGKADGGSQMVQPAPSVPPSGRWLGYGIVDATTVKDVAAYTNILWLSAGADDSVFQAARAAGLKVALVFECKKGKSNWSDLQMRVLAKTELHRDVVAAVCWEMPDVNNVEPAEVAAFGRKLKDRAPVAKFWCNLVWQGRQSDTFSLPEEVDGLMVELGLASPEAIVATADRALPKSIARAGKRPVMLVWFHGHSQKPQGLVPECRPGTMRTLGDIVDKYRLKGLFLVSYGTGSRGAVGICTNPTLVEEIKEIGKKWGIEGPASDGSQ
jgi:formylglycine-generating enzyme required for sulfatase activity/serine/threonine protein kinase